MPYRGNLLRGKDRSVAQRDADMARLSELYLQGFPYAQILDKMNVERERKLTLRQVKYDIESLHKNWAKTAAINYVAAKNKELARIDALEHTYWQAWFKSWEELEKTFVERFEDKTGIQGSPRDAVRTRTRRETEKLLGEVRYLEGIQWCITERCKIMGLHTPDRHQIDWRLEAKKAGIDDEPLAEQFERMVQNFSEQLDRSDDAGGAEGSEET